MITTPAPAPAAVIPAPPPPELRKKYRNEGLGVVYQP